MNDRRNAYALRNGVLNLLSDEDVASVCTSEWPERLSDGEEYLDLEQLDQGVLRSLGLCTPMGWVLPRKSVRHDTWSKILVQLTRHCRAESPSVPTPRIAQVDTEMTG
jgi:hypothetical protein